MADGLIPQTRIAPPDRRTQPVGIAEKLFTADDLITMADAGLFTDTERAELIDGRVYVAPSEGPGHRDKSSFVGRQLQRMLFERPELDQAWVLVPQLTIRVSETRLVCPDYALFKRSSIGSDTLATPAEVGLAVEIADSSLRFDEGDKKEIYAEAGIADYWIVRLPHGNLRVCRSPSDGLYAEDAVLPQGESVAPLVAPDYPIAISALFGS